MLWLAQNRLHLDLLIGNHEPEAVGCILVFCSPILLSEWDPFAETPKPNRTLIYLGACIIAGLRLARERQVNVRVIPTSAAIEEIRGPVARNL